jgi:3-oxoacyl-[acyl-carrier-protein] synthase II
MTGVPRQVMITGIGLFTGLAEGPRGNWEALLAGRTAIRRLKAYDPAPLRTQLGAEIDGFDPLRFASRRALRTLNRGDQLGLAGATLALADAGIDSGRELGHRTGLFLGGNKEVPRLDDLLESIVSIRGEDGTPDLRKLGQTASSVMAPLFFVEGLQSAALFHVSQKFGIRGPNCFFAGTAESGAAAIGRAMRAIRRGEADLAIAGGYDDATNWWPMSKADSLGVLATDNDAGASAFRPFDRHRDGSLLGEGAALVVLEERAAALARGAACYAEIIGFGAGNDCHRPPAPDPCGRGLAAAIRRALGDGRVSAEDLCFVAAHGSATRTGDVSETRALRRALGSAAAAIPVSSIKPQTGHLVGAAGALNVVVAALAIRYGAVPATPNLDDPDPECDLDYVPGEPRQAKVALALALARGFEGQAAALALAEPS